MYILVRVEDAAVQEVLGTYKELLEAEHELSKIHDEYEDEILGWDDDYVQIEDDYGNIVTYQFFYIEEDKKDKKNLKKFNISVAITYEVTIHNEIEIEAENKEEAIEILKEKIDKDNLDFSELKHIDEFWTFSNYKILDSKKN